MTKYETALASLASERKESWDVTPSTNTALGLATTLEEVVTLFKLTPFYSEERYEAFCRRVDMSNTIKELAATYKVSRSSSTRLEDGRDTPYAYLSKKLKALVTTKIDEAFCIDELATILRDLPDAFVDHFQSRVMQKMLDSCKTPEEVTAMEKKYSRLSCGTSSCWNMMCNDQREKLGRPTHYCHG